MSQNADYWIDRLNLKPHPEGGFFKETYRSEEILKKNTLPDRYSGDRSFSTCVYFLIRNGDHSCMHRIQSDEVWHFYAGSSMTLYIIHPDGRLEETVLGADPDKGQTFQVVIPRHTWFGASVDQKVGFSLVGCTIAPGFDFDDFELADRDTLISEYPQHKDLISRLS